MADGSGNLPALVKAATPNIAVRAVEAVRYTIAGVIPGGWMSPGQPLPPQHQEAEGRAFDYPQAYNLNYLPRAYEKTRFVKLKALARNCDLLKTVMNRQKDLMESFDWNIKPRENAQGKRAASTDPMIGTLEDFFRYPDKDHDWAQWLRALLDQLFVLDAVSIYRRRDKGALPYSFELMDGATIRILIDNSGRKPQAPSPAYQQVLKGIPAVDYTSQTLLYFPQNFRIDQPFGYPAVEQIMDYIETAIERLKSQKAFFTDGNLADGLFTGPVEWKMDQIMTWQGYWDSLMSGNVVMRRKGWWVPFGTEFKPIKPPPLKDEFDEWLARVICFAFSTSPQPFIKQVSRGNQENQQQVAEEGGIATTMAYVKRVIDRLIAEDFGRPDLEFVWREDREFDPMVQAEIQDLKLRNGSLVIDEARDQDGLDPLPDGLGKVPLIYSGTGATTIADVLDPPEPPAPMLALPGPKNPLDPKDPKATPPKDKAAKPSAKAKSIAKAHRDITVARPKARRAIAALAKGIAPVLAKTGDAVAAEVEKHLVAFGKADDAEPDAAKQAALAAQLSKVIDLSGLDDIEGIAFDDLFEVAFDAAQLGFAQVGVQSTDALLDQVNQAAVAYAKRRAGELVSVQGDKNIVDSTRNMVRDLIADGLANNLGSAKIAESIQDGLAFGADRAQLIAFTEIAMANGAGKMAGWKEAQGMGLVLTKAWDAEDEACPICEANEDQGDIPLDEPFSSGDDTEPAHPACRCSVSAQAEEASE
jgi:hypothetical protein